MWYKSALLILALVVVGVYSDPQCDGVCYSSGDPHYQSFDCKIFEFQGQCSYTLMKACDPSLPAFEVISDNEPVPYHPDYTYTKSILIKFEDKTIRLTDNMDIFVNGEKQDAPSISTDIGSITIVNDVIVVKTIWQFTLSYGSPFKTVISLDGEQLPGKICGVCGNANEDPSDDFKTPDKELVDDADLFGNSWNVEENCQGKGVVVEIPLGDKTTSQSSEGWGRPQRAVDGNTNGNWKGASCTMTRKELGAWWMVDLENTFRVDRVAIYNRVDKCCDGRLVGAIVRIGDDPNRDNPICGTVTSQQVEMGPEIFLSCDMMGGQYFSIELPTSTYLILCEVRLFGNE